MLLLTFPQNSLYFTFNIANTNTYNYDYYTYCTIDLLIAGLLERKLRIISATDNKQSIFSPAE
jgi:hypothetical protein